MFSFLLIFSSFAFAAPVTVALSDQVTVSIQLNERASAENSISFFQEGKLIQTERNLGDTFVKFEFEGKNSAFHALDLDQDGTKEILVRVGMMPAGVIRVFKWNAFLKKFDRLRFGKNKEDGIPVPLANRVALGKSGSIFYVGGSKKNPAQYSIEWNGHDYVLPAKKK